MREISSRRSTPSRGVTYEIGRVEFSLRSPQATLRNHLYLRLEARVDIVDIGGDDYYQSIRFSDIFYLPSGIISTS